MESAEALKIMRALAVRRRRRTWRQIQFAAIRSAFVHFTKPRVRWNNRERAGWGLSFFDLHGIAADSNAVTRDSRAFASVVDINLTPLSPASIAVTAPNNTVPVTFQVTMAGSFHGVVNLSCLGLPVGGSCNFSQATTSPTSTTPVNVTLTINAAAYIPTRSFSVMVVGTTAGGPTKVQGLTLLVTAPASRNYTLIVSNPALTAPVNTLATLNGTLTSVNSYSSQVNLSCGAGAPPSCAAVPAIVTPSAAGEPFAGIVSSVSAQNYSFNIVGLGTDASSITQAAPVPFSTATGSNGDFLISNTSGPQTVQAGTAAQYVLTFTPIPAGSMFSNSASYSCSTSRVPLSSCSFSPVSPIPANSPEAQIT